ncbi:hypothetical protein JH06_0542 [Blastocystis sp. subtype 4]|uniref:hypothetical protein n=1 Tax=Blastocystis sp. subtype 4 TaxID=944170 RepID=UPI0007117B45|nr:hypothetical protein JH06_0542 [Blastocystis sp. subtype 4]KNB45866.1 hypothetical protein JH06_0542 [Blastocystis sp. subtype 4]|eukprot:XP_014529309.1 hypothetical protein JH06_0542 [Blastocystis sp. subtype 4]
MFFSSHKEVEESQYSAFYEQNQWLKSGCMVPSISEDSSVRMCISGLLVEGGDPGVLISKNFSPESLEHIQNESLPCLTLKPFTSPFAFDIGKMKAPSGLLVSRNTSALHDPLVIDSCFLEGKKEENGVCIRFKKEVFKERLLMDVMGQILSLVHPYLCSFNLPFWNILFPYPLCLGVIHRNPLVPQVLSSVPSAKQSSLPLLRGLALVFPMSTATLYVYQPNHLYMLHKHLHESFIVTPPNQSQSDLGTICHVEEVVSVGADGAVLCKVRGDQKVHVTQLHPVMSEMGSVLGDSSIAEDIEGDSVCDESSGSWKTMLRVREKILTLYHNHSMCDEVIKRYGSIPYHPRLFSYW